MRFWQPFRQPAQPIAKSQLPPFRYPLFFEPFMSSRHNNTAGYNMMWTVSPGQEVWITAVQGSAAAAAAAIRTGVIVLYPDGATLYKRLAVIDVLANQTGHYELEYPMPMVIPENYIIAKWVDLAHTISTACVFGWIGQTPEGIAYGF